MKIGIGALGWTGEVGKDKVLYAMEKILPAKYYLDHFTEFTDFLKSKYQFLFQNQHRVFLEEFENLSEDAQCVYVRMSNRKGHIFFDEDLQYEEIANLSSAIDELIKAGFAARLASVTDTQADFENSNEQISTQAYLKDIIQFLDKPRLCKLLEIAAITFKKSAKKDDLIELALNNVTLAHLAQADFFSKLLIREKRNELQYLSFLYFGEIQKNLALYTLRDLGIRQANENRSEFKARFETKEQAHTHYFYAQLAEGELAHLKFHEWPTPVDTHTQVLRGEVLLQSAAEAEAEDEENYEEALTLYTEAKISPGRERKVRLLTKLDRKDEALIVLNEILDHPNNTEELIFAEDFLERKYHKKRTSRLTDILRDAEEIWLDEAYYRKPENGTLDHFRNQGLIAHDAENFLWNSLFGLIFWDELFENEKAAIYNPFERRSVTILGPAFYEQNQKSIDEKLKKLTSRPQAIQMVLKTITEKYGTLNAIFQWHPATSEMLMDFLKHANPESVAKVLTCLVKDYDSKRTGFPDIFIVKNNEIYFYEIKAEGDQLKSHQLDQIKLLKESGFHVDLLKVKWAHNPNQVFVVVDVETTGGMAKYHRLTEIGALKIQNGKVIDQFQTLLNPGRPIPKNITQLTGITNEMVADAPKFEEIAEKFDEFTKNAIFAAHFARFDYSFIQSEYQRLDQIYTRPTFCTVSQSRKHFPGLKSYKLSSLCEHFDIRLDNHHRALCDAQAATEILFKIQQKRSQN